jgi:hypothetical protein
VKTELGGRPYNEDRYVAISNFVKIPCPGGPEDGALRPVDLFAVLDGHGTDYVSDFCARHLGEQLRPLLLQCADDEQVRAAISRAFISTDELLRKEHGSHAQLAGTTAVVSLVAQDRIYTGSCGAPPLPPWPPRLLGGPSCRQLPAARRRLPRPPAAPQAAGGRRAAQQRPGTAPRRRPAPQSTAAAPLTPPQARLALTRAGMPRPHVASQVTAGQSFAATTPPSPSQTTTSPRGPTSR